MGTENTASVILQGAQLTAQANAGLSNAIVQGFGQLQSAIKFNADLQNQMVKATQDARQTDIDEWYKSQQLKLNDRQLSIQENHYSADIAYRNAILNQGKKDSDRIASTAPVNAAIKTHITSLGGELKNYDALERKYNAQLTGKIIDEKTGEVHLIGEPMDESHGEDYFKIKSQLQEIQSKKEQATKRIQELATAGDRIQMGDDPTSVYNDTFPDETFTPRTRTSNSSTIPNNNIRMDKTTPLYRDYAPGESRSNPLFPAINPNDENQSNARLQGQQAFDIYQSPEGSPDGGPDGSPDGRKSYTPSKELNASPTLYEELTPKPVYKNPGNHEYFLNDLINDAKKNKTDFNYQLAQQSLSRTDPEYQKQVQAKQASIQIDAFRSIGKELASRFQNPQESEANLKAIDRLTDKYKESMMRAGGDPNLIDVAANKADLALIDFRTTTDFNSAKEDPNKNAKAFETLTTNYLLSKAEGILFGTKKEAEQPKVGGLTSALGEIKTSSPSLFAPDGSVKVSSRYGESDKPKIDNNYINLRTQFDKEFKNNEPSKENPLPVSRDYVNWINSLDKPEDFGINTTKNFKELKNPSFSNYSGFTDSSGSNNRDKDTIKQLIINRKREIVNDPDRAFYFWLDKKKRDQVKDMPEFQKYLKENVE